MFVERTRTKGERRRWIATIKEHHLHVNKAGLEFNIEKYYGRSELFDAPSLDAQVRDRLEDDDWDGDDELFPEGGYRTHKSRERQPGLRAKVLRRERKKGLACQACDRGPVITSRGPKIEEAMFEVHHRKPLSGLDPNETIKTRTSECALLCATCHRLIHRLMRLDNRTYDVPDLRAALGR
jgi:predicted HNH restriction endonuclease